MCELHILNGDFALTLFQQCGLKGESLVWKETYLEGPLPDTEDLDLFRSARAEYLSGFSELAGVGAPRLYEHLRKMDETLCSSFSSLMLWFDSCIFDQTILMRLFSLLRKKGSSGEKIYLYCCRSHALELHDFRQGASRKVLLTPGDLELGEKAWHLFCRKDASGMVELSQKGDFQRLPAMKKALLRCAEEVPNENGLTRTQREILQLLRKGPLTFLEIFKGLDAFEECPFLGDTACQRILEGLLRKGLLAYKDGTYTGI